MNFEKIEEAYTLLLENVQVIQNKLSTNFYDALIEQNGIYLDGQTDLEIVKKNHQTLKSLKLSREEWRRVYSSCFSGGDGLRLPCPPRPRRTSGGL